jgi:hypothetical protein
MNKVLVLTDGSSIEVGRSLPVGQVFVSSYNGPTSTNSQMPIGRIEQFLTEDDIPDSYPSHDTIKTILDLNAGAIVIDKGIMLLILKALVGANRKPQAIKAIRQYMSNQISLKEAKDFIDTMEIL